MNTPTKSPNQRMSLNPNNPNQHSFFQKVQKGNSTEVEVSSGVQPESISSISNLEQYSSEDLEKIFATIAGGKDTISVQDLYSILQEQGYNECLYSAVQMVALVDESRKGYVTRKQFFRYFSSKNYEDEEKIPALSREMLQDRKWVGAIEQNWQSMKEFQDKDYCYYVAEKIKEFQKKGI